MSSDRLAQPYRFAVTGAAFAGVRLLARRPLVIPMVAAVWMITNLGSEVAWRAIPIGQPAIHPLLSALAYLLPVPPALAATGLLIRPIETSRLAAALRLTIFWLVTVFAILLAIAVFLGGAMMLMMSGRSGIVELDGWPARGVAGLTLLGLAAGLWVWGRLSVAAPLVAEGRPGAIRTGWAMTASLQRRLAGAMLLAGFVAVCLLGGERILRANLDTVPLNMQVQDGRIIVGGGGFADPSFYGWAAVYGLVAGIAAVIMLAPGAAICGRNLSEGPESQADVFD